MGVCTFSDFAAAALSGLPRNIGTSEFPKPWNLKPEPWRSSIQRLWIQRLQLWIFFNILLTFVLVRSGEAPRLESASLACHSHFRFAHPFQSDQYRTPSSSIFVGQTKTHCSHRATDRRARMLSASGTRLPVKCQLPAL